MTSNATKEVFELRKEEYKSLRLEISYNCRMQIQVFTFSMITSMALLGIILKFGNDTYTSISIFSFFIPTLITIPCAYLVKNLRSGIYRMGTYIQVFVEEDSPLMYEGSLGVMREKFQSKESLDPIFCVYWVFFCLCCFLFFAVKLEAKLPTELWHWQSLPWLVAALFLANANRKYKEIPNTKRRQMLDEWRIIRSKALLGQDQNSK